MASSKYYKLIWLTDKGAKLNARGSEFFVKLMSELEKYTEKAERFEKKESAVAARNALSDAERERTIIVSVEPK